MRSLTFSAAEFQVPSWGNKYKDYEYTFDEITTDPENMMDPIPSDHMDMEDAPVDTVPVDPPTPVEDPEKLFQEKCSTQVLASRNAEKCLLEYPWKYPETRFHARTCHGAIDNLEFTIEGDICGFYDGIRTTEGTPFPEYEKCFKSDGSVNLMDRDCAESCFLFPAQTVCKKGFTPEPGMTPEQQYQGLCGTNEMFNLNRKWCEKLVKENQDLPVMKEMCTRQKMQPTTGTRRHPEIADVKTWCSMYKDFKDSGEVFPEYKNCFKPDGTFDPTEPECVQSCKTRTSQPACKEYLDSIAPPPYVCVNPIGVSTPYSDYKPGVIYMVCEQDDPLRNIYPDQYDAIVTSVQQGTVETFTTSMSAAPSSVTLTVNIPTTNSVQKIVINKPDRVFKVGDKVKTYGKGRMVAGVFIPGPKPPGPKPPAPKPTVFKGIVFRVINADSVKVEYKDSTSPVKVVTFNKKAHGLKALQPLNVSVVNGTIVSVVASGPVPTPVTVQGVVIGHTSATTIIVKYTLNGKEVKTTGPGIPSMLRKPVIITLIGNKVVNVVLVPKPVVVSGVVISRVLPKTITVQYTLAGKVTRSVFTTAAVKFKVSQPVTITLLNGKVTNVVAAVPKPVIVSGKVIRVVNVNSILVRYTDTKNAAVNATVAKTNHRMKVGQVVKVTLLNGKITSVV
ncbi:hypothetical protein PBCVCVR1_622L [Paramecium bursaria Chlorella virus CVR-1]|uniref:Surface protein n=1 Tax=Paramecium bursaria Chlorella virus CVA-1 TaxID=42683 RepID=M1HK87_9PHYC|nr:hypothetical protein F8205_gp261 [Paramecium bursaria Chlorella virus CVA-1]AGE50564.1 hypothetical protein PBCVCVA1_613L [Paramecium bursaria Chlorella virus CVA-1]AGE52243.1 hypothetical protein PBCVCVR1_622L [Paramecium bursaria Chlorella virus CVR-1]